MHGLPALRTHPNRLSRALACAGLALASAWGHAAEGYRLRLAPVGTLAGEAAAPAANPGFFATATITHAEVTQVTDGSGNGITTPSRSTLTSLPLAGYTLTAPANPIDFRQTQTTINLVGGYLGEQAHGGGHIALAVNLPLVDVRRSFAGVLGPGSLTTPAGAPVPAGSPLALGANAAAAAGWNALVAAQNQSVTGLGDAELSATWIRHSERMRATAGASLVVPTGSYDKNRGPNPGFGDFYTLRLGGSVAYSLAAPQESGAQPEGITLSGRLGWGTNSRNKATSYRSGDFVYAEVGARQAMGAWALGASLLHTQQVSDDDGPVRSASCLGGVDPDGCRYRIWSLSPFIAWRPAGRDLGLNLQYSQTFGARNAQQVRALQLRIIKAW